MPGEPKPLAVFCHACLRTAWEGDTMPAGEDGDALLAKFAGPDGVPCPGNNAGCPHKPAARQAYEDGRAVTIGELDALKDRLDRLEGEWPCS